MRLIIASVLVGSALLAGCSSNRRCEGEQPYQSAETLPTPGQIPGLTIPESPSALRIPAAPVQPEPYGKKVADPKKGGSTHYECLDVPPRMVGPPEPPAAVAPTPTPTPTPAAEPAKS